MASAWSLDGQQLTPGAEAGSPVPIKQNISPDEHTALLCQPNTFESLHRKEDLIAEEVHSGFGVKEGKANLQALTFPVDRFTPVEAKDYLPERGFEPLLFTEATESRHPPTVERSVDGQPRKAINVVLKEITGGRGPFSVS